MANLAEINVDQLLHVNSKILRLIPAADVQSYFKNSSIPKVCEQVLQEQGLLLGNSKGKHNEAISSKLTATNPAIIFSNIGQLLDIVQHLPDASTRISFLVNIPNLRSLMGPDLIKLYEIIQSCHDDMSSTGMRAKFMQDIKKILLVSASNLETVKNIDFRIYDKEN